MEILGIGPLEFLFIVIIALVVLGPKGLVKYSQQAGSFIRRVVQSPAWRSMIDSTREIRKAQDQFMQETGLQDSLKEVERDVRQGSQSINQTIRKLDQPVEASRPQPVLPSSADPKPENDSIDLNKQP